MTQNSPRVSSCVTIAIGLWPRISRRCYSRLEMVVYFFYSQTIADHVRFHLWPSSLTPLESLLNHSFKATRFSWNSAIASGLTHALDCFRAHLLLLGHLQTMWSQIIINLRNPHLTFIVIITTTHAQSSQCQPFTDRFSLSASLNTSVSLSLFMYNCIHLSLIFQIHFWPSFYLSGIIHYIHSSWFSTYTN